MWNGGLAVQLLDKIFSCGIVPVAVIDNASFSVPLADALQAGGIDIVEVTFRTESAAQSIRRIALSSKEMVVGAGTVTTIDQCKCAVENGAQFIVSPGFSEELVSWCLSHSVPVIPGCVTPTEIMRALSFGLHVLKFFPAGVFGGLSALKALSGPFSSVRFIPTGGVNNKNLGEYLSAPFIHAVGGSWLCPRADISAERFSRITELCKEARKEALGFELSHVGVNMPDEQSADALCQSFMSAFGFDGKKGNSSYFSSPMIEIMKKPGRGDNGHLAIRTNRAEMAIEELRKRGYEIDESSIKQKEDRISSVYLNSSFGGFDVHLIQK